MALQRYELTLLMIGLLPIFILTGAALIVFVFYLIQKIRVEDAVQVSISVGTIFLLVYSVMILTGIFCSPIHPTEQFTTMSMTPLQKLWIGISSAEKEVCKLITRTDQYIQSDVGHPGQLNPQLVTDAQQHARNLLPGPITDCTSPGAETETETETDAENRITRMEITLQSFTGPKFQDVYNRTVQCEGFTTSPLASLEERLQKINSVIQEQQTKLLQPIDAKNKALQGGDVSDCDKRRGASAAVNASIPSSLSPSK
jgi:hypothetical protein